MRWPKYWSFSFSNGPYNEHPGLISFRMDWLDLRAVQGTLKSLLQHHSSKVSSFWHSAFFTVQLSHPYMTTGKNIALTRWAFVGKVMSLLFNILSRLVITFLPRSKCLLISWLQSPSAVILYSHVQFKSFIWVVSELTTQTSACFPFSLHYKPKPFPHSMGLNSPIPPPSLQTILLPMSLKKVRPSSLKSMNSLLLD